MNDWKDRAADVKKSLRLHLYEALSVLPPAVLERFMSQCILSGSSISSVYHGESANDFDLYARNLEDIKPIHTLIEKSFPEIIEEYDSKYPGAKGAGDPTGKIVTGNAITLKGKTQFITISDFQTMRKTFDLKHCLPYYDLKEDKLYISESQMLIIDRKILVPNQENGVVAPYRLEKFKKRGWKML